MTHPYQLILISNRPIPNLTPALDRSFGAQKVFMLVEEAQRRKARCLEDVFKRYGIKTEIVPVSSKNDILEVTSAVKALCSRFKPDELVLNVSGGSHVERCGAFQVFFQQNRPVFCVEAATDELIWIHPAEKAKHNLEDRLRLKPYLEAFGNRVLGKREALSFPAAWRELQQFMVHAVEDLQHAISVMNYYASRGEWDPYPQISRKDWLNRPFRELLKRCVQLEIVELDSKRIAFSSEQARRFLNGDWLELYVYHHLDRLRQHCPIHDLAIGLEFESQNGNKNEMDVVLLSDNVMHFIECKTSNMQSRKMKRYGQGVLYKLETVTDQAGMFAKAMLVSYRDLKDSDKQRARDLKIKTVCASQLKQLDQHLTSWLRSKT
ncbi:MAG: hypothetical protein CSA81_02565 [Acidobacteria bacterium]|nr:MAG: hypothetical protein CSA81_02565 [Acidobacteriota bacterium]